MSGCRYKQMRVHNLDEHPGYAVTNLRKLYVCRLVRMRAQRARILQPDTTVGIKVVEEVTGVNIVSGKLDYAVVMTVFLSHVPYLA